MRYVRFRKHSHGARSSGRSSGAALARLLLGAVLTVTLAGCSLAPPHFPADPDGTLERVRSTHVLHAGAAPNPGWVELESPRRPSGREVRLVERYAATLDAEVEWTVGTEEHLVGLLEDGELDLVVGGLTDTNPWVSKVALTRPYVEVTVSGTPEAHVVMLPMGENALLTSVERWLDEHAEVG